MSETTNPHQSMRPIRRRACGVSPPLQIGVVDVVDMRKDLRPCATSAPSIPRQAYIYFTGLEVTQNILIPKPLALRRAIRRENRNSLYRLVRVAGCDLKSSQRRTGCWAGRAMHGSSTAQI